MLCPPLFIILFLLVILHPTGLVVQLANKSITRPKGVVEDVLVKVNDLIFPVDFYILDMQRETSSTKATLIFGRPFLRTARTKIDVYAGTLSMEFGDNIINFNIFDAMKHPNEEHSLFALELLADLIDDECANEFTADCPSFSDLDDTYTCESCTDVQLCSTCVENDLQVDSHDATDGTDTDNTYTSVLDTVTDDTCTDNVTNHTCIVSSIDIHDVANVDITADSSTMPLPSIEKPPTLELKPLPQNLKYAYLGESETLPVIISSNLEAEQEGKLLEILKTHKKAIGWTLADIPGISPSMCMHRILLEDGAKPVRQPQRRLNPLILDVVKKEVTKLLQAGIIYPISDSQWVSPVQVVPKKTGLTVVKNENNELIPTRVQNSWRVCIDYRRLNQASRKD
jgi:hypothetical protein